MVKKAFFIILILILPAAIFAEGSLTLDMAVNNLVFRTPDQATEDDYYWAWLTSGSGGFSFESEGNRNVKSELQFSFNYPELAASLGYSPSDSHSRQGLCKGTFSPVQNNSRQDPAKLGRGLHVQFRRSSVRQHRNIG